MTLRSPDNKLAIYQAKNGAIELSVDAPHETIWASQAQISELFGIDQSGVARHIHNILKNNEVDPKSNMQKMHIAHADRPTTFYSLDIILGVGYRANSANAITFRRWANNVLKQYITEGYAINPARIQSNYSAFLKAVEDIKLISQDKDQVQKSDVLELVQTFANTWLSLDAYDSAELPQTGSIKQDVVITASELNYALNELKQDLLAKGQASELFAQPKEPKALEGLVGNIYQSFDGNDLYPSVEEKSAHLLYFLTKNHIFNDGNKRSAAFAFIWYLQRAGLLHADQLTPTALTALTLLIAESNPKEKDKLIGLVLLLLGQH